MSGAGAANTCSDGLPADGEGGPGLHHVHGNRAVVVGPRAPGQFHRGVGDVGHLQAFGGTGGSCRSQTDKGETRQHQRGGRTTGSHFRCGPDWSQNRCEVSHGAAERAAVQGWWSRNWFYRESRSHQYTECRSSLRARVTLSTLFTPTNLQLVQSHDDSPLNLQTLMVFSFIFTHSAHFFEKMHH